MLILLLFTDHSHLKDIQKKKSQYYAGYATANPFEVNEAKPTFSVTSMQ